VAVAAAVLLGVAGCADDASQGTVTDRVTKTVTVTEPPTSAPPTSTTRKPAVAENLVIRDGLREVWRSLRPNPNMQGPLPGRSYYASYENTYWGIAFFEYPGVGDYPSLFVKRPGSGRWQYEAELTGDPISAFTFIPCPVRRVWGFGCDEAPVGE
jgi:hypothetical protein